MADQQVQPPQPPALQSWVVLNAALADADEALCEALLKAELAGRRRRRYALRIHSRLNRMRAGRERIELKEKTTA